MIDSAESQRHSLEISAADDDDDTQSMVVSICETDTRSVIEDDTDAPPNVSASTSQSESDNEKDDTNASDTHIPVMMDSGISASMNISCDSFQHKQMHPSTTQDSMQLSWPSDDDSSGKADAGAEAELDDVKVSSAGIKVETLNVSKTLLASHNLNISIDSDGEQLVSSEDLTLDVKAHRHSDEFVEHSEEYLAEPKLETETKVEILPDGTVVTRKITKTTRKRVVAKSVLTKSDEGEVTVRSDTTNSERVRKFLSLGSATESTSRPAADVSPDGDSTASRFLNLTHSDFENMEETHTEDLPTETNVERKITVVQSQTTVIEGDDNAASSEFHPASAAASEPVE